MKAEVKAAWIADLRANPDAQGNAQLDYIDTDGKRKQCCLGRLCLLAVKAGVIPPPELYDETYHYLDGYDGSESFGQDCMLPRRVAEWAGLPAGRDDIVLMPAETDSPAVTAIAANDGMGMSFAEIADEAEKNVPAE